jgi:8-oxo-dGTP pyrophosphatase MutT (NUDIX family)
MSPERGYDWRKERWPVTASVAAYLRFDARSNGLLLVQSGEGRWALPSGGLNPDEYLIDGTRREIAEESGVEPRFIFFDTLAPREVICLPGEERTQIGLVFIATYRGPILPREGWPVPGQDKMVFAKPFKMKDLVKLLASHLGATRLEESPLYKPRFNFPLILNWVLQESGPSSYSLMPNYVISFLKRWHGEIDHLSVTEDELLGGEIWYYQPPFLIGTQDPEAVRRASTLRWGE